jgi:ParB-like chromosome segregation protein Spo0J
VPTVPSACAHGVVVSVVVLPPAHGEDLYELVMGHRRYHGSHEAGRDTISAYVLDPSIPARACVRDRA